MVTMTAPITRTDRVLAAVLDDARLMGADLAVVAEASGLVLSGTVRNIWQYQTLRAILRKSPVVVDVGISAARRSDSEITDTVRDALGPEGACLRARVRSGIVTLTGAADAEARDLLLTRIGTMPGVVGIVDNIRA